MKKLNARDLLYGMLFSGLVINGWLYTAYFLADPHPDRIGYWFVVYFVVLPFLGTIALVTLLTHRALRLSWYGGALVFAYALGVWLLALALGLVPALASLMPIGGYEVVCVVLLATTLAGLVVAALRDYRSSAF